LDTACPILGTACPKSLLGTKPPADAWTCQVVDLDSHGLGCMELLAVTLTVLHAEFALSPTILTDDGRPAFYFDHRARGHDGLVISGGSGGRKKCFQFLEGILEGVRSPKLAQLKQASTMFRGGRVAVEEDAFLPVSSLVVKLVYSFFLESQELLRFADRRASTSFNLLRSSAPRRRCLAAVSDALLASTWR
jgi:hypothetical protein